MEIKVYLNIYEKIYHKKNLISAWRKARKGKTKKKDIQDFENNFIENINLLHEGLKNRTYKPKPLKVFVLRDPKTRKISKSDFGDRIVHHAICNIIEPIFEAIFIYENTANRKGKGGLFALEKFGEFQRKVSKNNSRKCFLLKADIKHYFREINHKILSSIIKRKISDERTLWLIKKILQNPIAERETQDFAINLKGMPLGNLTSQFFANVYLNELDQFVKHKLKAKYYIRYVDDFVILNKSKNQLRIWKREIEKFLEERLNLELHLDKSKIILLDRGVDFVGFRNFYYFKLMRKRNIKSIKDKIKRFKKGKISEEKFKQIFQGWNAYASWANSYNLRKNLSKKINHFP